MADGRHFIFISLPWIIRFWSNLVHGSRCKFPLLAWKFDINRNFSNSRWRYRIGYWKSYFGYISSPYWPINANFGMEMKNHTRISVLCVTMCVSLVSQCHLTLVLRSMFLAFVRHASIGSVRLWESNGDCSVNRDRYSNLGNRSTLTQYNSV